MFSKFLVAAVMFIGMLFAMDALLAMSEQEDCWRMERQVGQGHIKALPEWCEEVPGR